MKIIISSLKSFLNLKPLLLGFLFLPIFLYATSFNIVGTVKYEMKFGEIKPLPGNAVALYFSDVSNQNSWEQLDHTGGYVEGKHYAILDDDGNFEFNFSTDQDLSGYNYICVSPGLANSVAKYDSSKMIYGAKIPGPIVFRNGWYFGTPKLENYSLAYDGVSSVNNESNPMNIIITDDICNVLRFCHFSMKFASTVMEGGANFTIDENTKIIVDVSNLNGYMGETDYNSQTDMYEMHIDSEHNRIDNVCHEFGHVIHSDLVGWWKEEYQQDKTWFETWAMFFGFASSNYINALGKGDALDEYRNLEEYSFLDDRYTYEKMAFKEYPKAVAGACFMWHTYDTYQDNVFEAAKYNLGDNENVSIDKKKVFDIVKSLGKTGSIEQYYNRVTDCFPSDQKFIVPRLYNFIMNLNETPEEGPYPPQVVLNAPVSTSNGLLFSWNSQAYGQEYFTNNEIGYHVFGFNNQTQAWVNLTSSLSAPNATSFVVTNPDLYTNVKVSSYHDINIQTSTLRLMPSWYPALEVNISGPLAHLSTETGQFTASISGGSGTYTSIRWYYSHDIGGPYTTMYHDDQVSVTRTDSQNYELKCVVTDDVGNTVTGLWYVLVKDVTDPFVFVKYPLASTEVSPAGALNIEWAGNIGSDYVTIEFSSDNGQSWTVLAENVPHEGLASGVFSSNQYTWLVESDFSSNCLIRISESSNTSLNDISDLFSVVLPPSNTMPSVSCGNDIDIVWPDNQVTLNGTVSDDGLPATPGQVSMVWSKKSGPGTVTFSDSSTLSPTVTLGAEGIYTLKLTATDGEYTVSDYLTLVAVNGVLSEPQTFVLQPGPGEGEDLHMDSSPVSPDMMIGQYNGLHRALIQFDLDSIPSDAYVTGANLRLWETHENHDGTDTYIDLHQVLKPWQQASVSWAKSHPDSADWNGCAPNDTASSSQIIASAKWQGGDLYSFPKTFYSNDFDYMVQEWVTSPGQNHGVLLKKRVEDTPYNYYFSYAASEHAYAYKRPRLTVTYRTVLPYARPEVNAGINRFITLPQDTVHLSATATDDGVPNPPGELTTTWSQVSGPGPVTFSDSSVVNTEVTFPRGGIYILRLTADDSMIPMSDDITIAVDDGHFLTEQTLVKQPGAANGKDACLYFSDKDGNLNGDIIFNGIYNSEINRGLIQFDLSEIPQNAVITGASLNMKVRGYTNYTGQYNDFNWHKVLTPWSETESCWNRPRNSGPSWNGGEPDDIHVRILPSATLPVKDEDYECLWWTDGLRDLVQEWVNNPGANYGMLLKQGEEVPYSQDLHRFYTSDYYAAYKHPKLIVTYKEYVSIDTIAFEDDFNGGNANKWQPLTPSRWTVGTESGRDAYYINTTNYNALSGDRLGEYSLIKDREFSDFVFTCKARSHDRNSDYYADYCIVFNYQDAYNYYYAMINRRYNYTGLYKIVNGARTTISYSGQYWIPDEVYHDIYLSFTKGEITLRFDDTRELTGFDDTFTYGQIGIGSLNDAVSFDDIEIRTAYDQMYLPLKWHVNSGGALYHDMAGNAWVQDHPFITGDCGNVGGNANTTAHAIANTLEDALYQSNLWAVNAYRFTMPSGDYQLRMLFAEKYFTSANQRVMDVSLEGSVVLDDFDIVAEVGQDVALDTTFQVTVSDGVLDIDFTSSVDHPMICGIEIIGETPVSMLQDNPDFSCQASLVPDKFELKQNYPNPFNPFTTIRYALPEKQKVQLVLYNIMGQQVMTLVDKAQKAGWYDIRLDGRHLASGIYIYRLKTDKFNKVKKLMLLK